MRSLFRPTLAGAYAAAIILVGAVFAAIVLTGFFFGLAIALIGGGVAASIAFNTGREAPRQIKTPGRDEITAALAACIVLAVTIPVAIWSHGYAWIGIPIAGGAAIWMLYAYSHPGYSVRESHRRQPGVIVTPPADIHVGLVDTLRQVDLFRDLDEQELRQLAELGDTRSLRKGQLLGAEGKVGDSFYVVIDGQADVSMSTNYGRERLRAAGPNDAVPVDALVGDGKLAITTRARTRLHTWKVDSPILRQHLDNHPSIGQRVTSRAETIVAERKMPSATAHNRV